MLLQNILSLLINIFLTFLRIIVLYYLEIMNASFTIEKYSPNKDFKNWLNDFEALVNALNYDQARVKHLIRIYLDDYGKDVLSELRDNQKIDLATIKVHMVPLMPNKGLTKEESQDTLNGLKKGSKTVDNFANEIRKLVRDAYPSLNADEKENMQTRSFIKGLTGDLKFRIELCGPTTLVQAVKHAHQQERYISAEPQE